MGISIKRTLAALAGTALLAGCATGPYYDSGYYYGDRYAYGAPTYYYDAYPGYVAPSVGLGFGYTYYDRDYRHWDGHRHREWRQGDRPVYERPDIPRDAPLANRDQDAFNQGRDGRGWSRDGSHSGG